jgi:hypothetical protein
MKRDDVKRENTTITTRTTKNNTNEKQQQQMSFIRTTRYKQRAKRALDRASTGTDESPSYSFFNSSFEWCFELFFFDDFFLKKIFYRKKTSEGRRLSSNIFCSEYEE